MQRMIRLRMICVLPCRYCQDERAPFNPNSVSGCSLWVNGSFYDNLNVGWVPLLLGVDEAAAVGAAAAG